MAKLKISDLLDNQISLSEGLTKIILDFNDMSINSVISKEVENGNYRLAYHLLSEVIKRDIKKRQDSEKRKKEIKTIGRVAFLTPMSPSDDLAAIVGTEKQPRTEIVKKVWAYIKKNDLQDKNNRRQVNCDAKLKAVMGGKKTVTMFEMTRLINANLTRGI